MGESPEKTVNRLIMWFLAPLSLLVVILMFIIPSFQRAGILYLATAVLCFIFYQTVILPKKKRLKAEIFGVKKNIFSGVFQGLLTAGAFIFLSYASPAFTIGVPPVPASAADQVKGFIVIVLAPVMEEAFFRGALLSLLLHVYGLPFAVANLIQAGLFSLTHLLAYGVFLEQLSSLSQVFGQVQAISGLFLAALVFGVVAGFVARKTVNLTPGGVAHGVINAYIFTFVLGAVTFG